MVKVGFRLTHGAASSGFFDRPKVMAEVDRATLRVLRIAGFRVRRTARRSLKRKPYTADSPPPGQPPHAHEENGLRRIYYSWDTATRAIVVGPVLFTRKVDGKTIPEIHEFGATVKTTVFGAGVGVEEKLGKYPQRPFMGPALEKHIPELPGLWKDALAK